MKKSNKQIGSLYFMYCALCTHNGQHDIMYSNKGPINVN